MRLRPAQPDAVARARASPEPTSYWDQNSGETNVEDSFVIGGSCPRPFKDVVVCATGILDRVCVETRRVAHASNLTRRRYHYSSSPLNSARHASVHLPTALPIWSPKTTAAQSISCVHSDKSLTMLRGLVAVRAGAENSYPTSILDHRKPPCLAARRRRRLRAGEHRMLALVVCGLVWLWLRKICGQVDPTPEVEKCDFWL